MLACWQLLIPIAFPSPLPHIWKGDEKVQGLPYMQQRDAQTAQALARGQGPDPFPTP